MKNDFYINNKKYYNKNAFKYENASWYYFNKFKYFALRRDLKLIYSSLKKKKINILEIGPGTGYLLNEILKLENININYLGIEHSKEMSKILEKNFSSKIKNFNLVNHSIKSNNLKNILQNKKFDLIIGSSILHHLPDYSKIIEILSNNLNKNGIMYFNREPIHNTECIRANYFGRKLCSIFNFISNSLINSKTFVNLFYPNKLKAENAQSVAILMFQDGVSILPFKQLIKNQKFEILIYRKYNRRLTSTLSFIENYYMKFLRDDIFGNTMFAIALKKK